MAQVLCHLDIAHVESAVQEAAYLAGEKLYDERAQMACDHSNKKWEVLHTHILAPEYAPTWVYSLEKLINSLVQAERQSNAQVLRKMMIVLPHELSHQQNIALTAEYAQTFLEEEGMTVVWAVHDKGKQPHAHLIFPMRPLLPSGQWGAKAKKVYVRDEQDEKIRLESGEYKSYKVRTTNWDDRGNCEKWRQRYQDIANKHLQMAGLDIRIDVRSYKRQGLDLIPTERLSRPEYEMQKRGGITARGERNRQIRETNQHRQTEKLVAVLKALAENREQQEAEQEDLYQQKVAEREATSRETLKQAAVAAEKWEQKNDRQTQLERALQEPLVHAAQATLKQEAQRRETLRQEIQRQVAARFEGISTQPVKQEFSPLPGYKQGGFQHQTAQVGQALSQQAELLSAIKQIGACATTRQEIPETIMQQLTSLSPLNRADTRPSAVFQRGEEVQPLFQLHPHHDRPTRQQDDFHHERPLMHRADLNQQASRNTSWEGLESKAAHIRLLTEKECEASRRLQVHEQWKARMEAIRQASKPEPRRLLESEFARHERRHMAEEYVCWEKHQQHKKSQPLDHGRPDSAQKGPEKEKSG